MIVSNGTRLVHSARSSTDPKEERRMIIARKTLAILTLTAVATVPIFILGRAHGSDHADTPTIAANPGFDISDVHLFPSPTNPNNVVLSLCVHPLLTTATAATASFDPTCLYQFKIDNTGDAVEDLVLQASFTGTGAAQVAHIAFGKPPVVGIISSMLTPDPVTGTINSTFTTSNGIKVFTGPREDPFFFDLEQFFTILPDRETPLNGIYVNDPDTPQAASFRPVGQAVDFLSSNHFNVLAIVAELPKSMLIGSGSGKIGVWCTTSVLGTSRLAKTLTSAHSIH
jgi:hypothetical protein